ncbi:hypothetical protein K431DRAFT_39330 [Polychaeton citri CBS 116435]|uniref:Myb-like domain-containing protein n=1 Tax=Polychaeton citri CBS 116435 TaxID=1314669 RepID=A0A9P4UNW4_9PEZI|nr:hypothetical protein K431DRAFT_39330 [Polychaeton citri CBS 116435]
MKTHVTYYDIKKDRQGRNSIVAHKTPVPSLIGSKVGAVGEGERIPDDAGEKKCDCAKRAKCENKVEKAECREVEGGKPNTDEKKDDGKFGAHVKNDDNKPDEKPWTTEEDAMLKKLKAENTSWRDIAQKMGRPQSQLKTRFKEIKDLPAIPKDGDEIKKSSQKPDNKKGKAENKHATPKEEKKKSKTPNEDGSPKTHSPKQKQEKPKPPAKQTPTKQAPAKLVMPTKPAPAYSRAPSALSRRSPELTLDGFLTLHEDATFSFGELQLLAQLIARDRSQTWLRIASAFFDKTGRKVHPHDIRDKFFQLESMS